jgi:tRNA nucleotidyltransferase/poly(A) polymerase
MGISIEMFKFYEVGGKIRDELLGLTNKDVDYVAVPSESTLELVRTAYTRGFEKVISHTTGEYSNGATALFKILEEELRRQKFEIFLVTPDCYTIRAKFPEGYKYQGVADFVMARKEVGYIPNTRTPIVEPGNLYDDLSRRDFTVNALAKDPDTGEIIDYFGGLKDIKEKLLRTPLPPIVTFDDDPLRILRGIRFSITKRLRVSEDMWQAMKAYDYFDKMPVVSEERIREELTKCFKCNSSLTLGWLSELTDLRDYIFKNTNLWLKPTSEK